jgi:hypothetical protein
LVPETYCRLGYSFDVNLGSLFETIDTSTPCTHVQFAPELRIRTNDIVTISNMICSILEICFHCIIYIFIRLF